jgi:hypothetical protein
LEGAFPSEISDIPDLLALWLDRNDISFDFTTKCNDSDGLFITADCAEVVCPCCSICCHGKKNATTCTFENYQIPSISQLDSFANSFGLEVPPDPTLPLRLALEWAMTQSRPKSRERIALATLFFSTGGENWADPLSLSEEDECRWNSVYDNTVKGVLCDADGKVDTIYLRK